MTNQAVVNSESHLKTHGRAQATTKLNHGFKCSFLQNLFFVKSVHFPDHQFVVES